jgi:hypothetical protein
MVTNAPSSPASFLPSPEQTALAIAILRAKPTSVSVRGKHRYLISHDDALLTLPDYILPLRRQIKRGRNPSERENPGHYIDLVAYWQQQCQQAQHECDRLRTINTKLERSNHQLTGRTITLDLDHVPPTLKRKPPPTSPTRSPKRPKPTQQMSVEQSSAAAQDTIENDADFLDVLGDGVYIFPSVETLLTSCRRHKSG